MILMNKTTRLIILEMTIETHLKELKKAYNQGYGMACYRRFEAGIGRAFDKINRLFPEKIRDGLTFQECMIFNSRVQGKLASYLR